VSEQPPADPPKGGRQPADQAGNQPGGQSGKQGEEPAETPAGSGPALARAALDAALSKRRASGRPRPGGDGRQPRRLRGYSGPGPDPRDPQLFGSLLERFVKQRGWQRPAAEASVFGHWERVVGADVAAHCRPIKLENGELTVEAESTAWATQLRMLAGKLLIRIAGEVGNNVVKRLHIHGPSTPSWSRGPRRVNGRGPRDTYG
jgi:predicted nucleic acid-binding Zn ribbon protein